MAATMSGRARYVVQLKQYSLGMPQWWEDIGQRRGEAANQATIGTGEGTLESLCAQAIGCPRLEGDRFATPGALLRK